MYIQTLFNVTLELITVHHLGEEGRIPAEGVNCSLSLAIPKEKLSHQHAQLSCLLFWTVVTKIPALGQQKCWTK